MATSPVASDRLAAIPRPLSATLLPSLTDIFFFAILFTLFLSSPDGWDRLVWDGDTGLHTRTGDYILDHGSVPTTDPFSFTKPGGRWFAFQWLTGVVFAQLNRWMGLKGIVLLIGILIAATCVILLRNMVRRGANGLLSMLLVLVAGNAMSIHYHARPHIFTLAFLALAHLLIARDMERKSAWFWSIVPMTALWTNLHSGFPVILVTLGLLVAGCAINALFEGAGWEQVRRYSIALALCGGATLLNPNGFALYGHISQFLNNPWVLQYVDEYKSPVFRSEAMYYFLGILFAALISVKSLMERKQWAPVLWILFFGAASLISSRHVPIFIVVALPFVAVELTSLFDRAVSGPLKDVADRVGSKLQPVSVWSLVVVVAIALLSKTFPADLSPKYFPQEMVRRHTELASFRVFTTDQWGDYLLWKNYPQQKVFIDGRSDYFQESIGNEYLQVFGASPGWQKTLDKYQITLALVPPDLPLVEPLRADAQWELIDKDKQALLFRRR